MRKKIKYFVFSDVHGQLDYLLKALDDAGYEKDNKRHMLINLGDLFDRGTQNTGVLDFVRERTKSGRILNILGNHDGFLKLSDPSVPSNIEFFDFNFTYNGFNETVANFLGFDSYMDMIYYMVSFNKQALDIQIDFHKKRKMYEWLLKDAVDEIIIGDHSFTHAGKDFFKKDPKVQENWAAEPWMKTPEFVQKYPNKFGRINVFGHWGAFKLNKEFNKRASKPGEMFVSPDGKFIGIDAWCGVSKKVLVYTFESDQKPIKIKDGEIVK